MIWSDALDAAVGDWADGVEIGAYGYAVGGNNGFGMRSFNIERFGANPFNVTTFSN